MNLLKTTELLQLGVTKILGAISAISLPEEFHSRVLFALWEEQEHELRWK